MGLIPLLTSVRGRIGRGSWWIGFAVTVAASVAGSLVIDPGIWTAEPPRAPVGLLALWEILLVAPATAITVKRFNDRDWPNWLGYAVGAVDILFIVAQQYGFVIEPEAASIQEQLVFGLIGAVWIFALIDNGFLKGTPGPNRYGPVPRA